MRVLAMAILKSRGYTLHDNNRITWDDTGEHVADFDRIVLTEKGIDVYATLKQSIHYVEVKVEIPQ